MTNIMFGVGELSLSLENRAKDPKRTVGPYLTVYFSGGESSSFFQGG